MRIYHTTSILDNNHSLHELCAHFGIVPLIYAVTSQWGRCSLQRSIAPLSILSILSISSSLITILWSSSVIPLLSHQWPDEHQHYQDSNPKKTWKKSCATILVITISKLPLFSMEYSQTFWGGDADFHSTKKKTKATQLSSSLGCRQSKGLSASAGRVEVFPARAWPTKQSFTSGSFRDEINREFIRLSRFVFY
jgi:hypothetical protein